MPQTAWLQATSQCPRPDIFWAEPRCPGSHVEGVSKHAFLRPAWQGLWAAGGRGAGSSHGWVGGRAGRQAGGPPCTAKPRPRREQLLRSPWRRRLNNEQPECSRAAPHSTGLTLTHVHTHLAMHSTRAGTHADTHACAPASRLQTQEEDQGQQKGWRVKMGGVQEGERRGEGDPSCTVA